jgi:hypothetical protein
MEARSAFYSACHSRSEPISHTPGRQFASRGDNPRRQISPPSIYQAEPLHSSCHPEVRSASYALLLSRGRFLEAPRNGTPRVYSVRRRFSAPAHSTREARLVCGVSAAIGHWAFQRYSSQHLLSFRSPFGFHFCFRSVPSGFVQRTGCSACGLGHPHQVWWAPPMYIAARPGRAWPPR